jgi:hypothetical protein
MFRHFSQDPTAAEHMRGRAPAVFEGLTGELRAKAQALLERHGCWEPLWRSPHPESRYDPDGQVPFKGRKVHYDNRR